MIIQEKMVVKGVIKESYGSPNLSPGVLCRVHYPTCQIGLPNANKRIYEKKVWENVLADRDIMEKLQNRTLYGHAEHPSEVQSNLEKTSHIITKSWIDESTNQFWQEVEVLNTPYGRIVNTLLEAGCQVGVSTRAEGELEEMITESGEKMNRVLPESYKYVTTDFTADPSTFNVAPAQIERQLVSSLATDLAEDKMDKQFATCLLESFRGDKAVALLKNLKEGCQCKKGGHVCTNCGCNKIEESFEVGNHVHVKVGQLQYKYGIIEAIDGDGCTLKLDENGESYPEIPLNTLELHESKINVGNMVTITEGKHKGAKGKVTEINEALINVALDDGVVVNVEGDSVQVIEPDVPDVSVAAIDIEPDVEDIVPPTPGDTDEPMALTPAPEEEMDIPAPEPPEDMFQGMGPDATEEDDPGDDEPIIGEDEPEEELDDSIMMDKKQNTFESYDAMVDYLSTAHPEVHKTVTSTEYTEATITSLLESLEVIGENVVSKKVIDNFKYYKGKGFSDKKACNWTADQLGLVQKNVCEMLQKEGLMETIGVIEGEDRKDRQIRQTYQAYIEKGMSSKEACERTSEDLELDCDDTRDALEAMGVYESSCKLKEGDGYDDQKKYHGSIPKSVVYDFLTSYYDADDADMAEAAVQDLKYQLEKTNETQTQIESKSKNLRASLISEATAVAERDTAVQLLEEKEAELIGTRLEAKLTLSESKLNEQIEKLNEDCEKLNEDWEIATLAYDAIKEEHDRDVNLLGKITSEKQAIEEKLSTLEEEVTELKEAHKSEVKDLKENNKKDRLNQYTTRCLDKMGLKLSPELRATFEGCTTTREVDRQIRNVRKMITESALHSTKIDSIQVKETTKVSPQENKINDRIDSVMEGFGF